MRGYELGLDQAFVVLVWRSCQVAVGNGVWGSVWEWREARSAISSLRAGNAPCYWRKHETRTRHVGETATPQATESKTHDRTSPLSNHTTDPHLSNDTSNPGSNNTTAAISVRSALALVDLVVQHAVSVAEGATLHVLSPPSHTHQIREGGLQMRGVGSGVEWVQGLGSSQHYGQHTSTSGRSKSALATYTLRQKIVHGCHWDLKRHAEASDWSFR